MAVHEALYFTKELRRIIVRSGEDVDEEAVRDQARKDGSKSLRDSGFEKVMQGLTSIQEVIGATMED
jgi:type IV pilus assembly protein PilB